MSQGAILQLSQGAGVPHASQDVSEHQQAPQSTPPSMFGRHDAVNAPFTSHHHRTLGVSSKHDAAVAAVELDDVDADLRSNEVKSDGDSAHAEDENHNQAYVSSVQAGTDLGGNNGQVPVSAADGEAKSGVNDVGQDGNGGENGDAGGNATDDEAKSGMNDVGQDENDGGSDIEDDAGGSTADDAKSGLSDVGEDGNGGGSGIEDNAGGNAADDDAKSGVNDVGQEDGSESDIESAPDDTKENKLDEDLGDVKESDSGVPLPAHNSNVPKGRDKVSNKSRQRRTSVHRGRRFECCTLMVLNILCWFVYWCAFRVLLNTNLTGYACHSLSGRFGLEHGFLLAPPFRSALCMCAFCSGSVPRVVKVGKGYNSEFD